MKQINPFYRMHKRIPYHKPSINYHNMLSIIEKANNYESIIDQKIIQFEQQSINISACPEYFENMVDRYITKLLGQLETEHVKNMRSIEHQFRLRASAKIKYQEYLDQLMEEICSTTAEYKLVKKLAEELNPLKHGRLTTEKTAKPEEEEEHDE